MKQFELIKAIKLGDKNAMEELITIYQPEIKRIVEKYNKNNVFDKDDLIQEANLFLLEITKNCDLNVENFYQYTIKQLDKMIYDYIYETIEKKIAFSQYQGKELKKLVKSLIKNDQLENSPYYAIIEDKELTANDKVVNEKEIPEENLIYQETLDNLERTLENLPPNQAGMIRLYYGIGCEKHNYKEISEKYNCSSTTVMNNINKAVKKITNEMNKIDSVKIMKQKNGKDIENLERYKEFYFNLMGKFPENNNYVKEIEDAIKKADIGENESLVRNYYGLGRDKCEKIVRSPYWPYKSITEQLIYGCCVRIELELSGEEYTEFDYLLKINSYSDEVNRLSKELEMSPEQAETMMINNFYMIKKAEKNPKKR